jgi:hypothetical protein
MGGSQPRGRASERVSKGGYLPVGDPEVDNVRTGLKPGTVLTSFSETHPTLVHTKSLGKGDFLGGW